MQIYVCENYGTYLANILRYFWKTVTYKGKLPDLSIFINADLFFIKKQFKLYTNSNPNAKPDNENPPT